MRAILRSKQPVAKKILQGLTQFVVMSVLSSCQESGSGLEVPQIPNYVQLLLEGNSSMFALMFVNVCINVQLSLQLSH
jgi:hypothetical protein